jgi:hypothetical protein
MSGLTPRPDKQQRKPVHAQDHAQDVALQPAAPQLPQRPPAAKPEQKPESETPQDKLGSVLMALAGKSPAAMPETLTWTKAGAVTVLPPTARAHPGAQGRALASQQSRAADVIEALTGRPGRTLSTRDGEAAWATLTAALRAGHAVVAGGGDDVPRERHDRAHTVLIVAAEVVDGERRVTLATSQDTSEALDFTDLCREFTEIAVADAN